MEMDRLEKGESEVHFQPGARGAFVEMLQWILYGAVEGGKSEIKNTLL